MNTIQSFSVALLIPCLVQVSCDKKGHDAAVGNNKEVNGVAHASVAVAEEKPVKIDKDATKEGYAQGYQDVRKQAAEDKAAEARRSPMENIFSHEIQRQDAKARREIGVGLDSFGVNSPSKDGDIDWTAKTKRAILETEFVDASDEEQTKWMEGYLEVTIHAPKNAGAGSPWRSA